MDLKIYNQNGEEVGNVKAPEAIFGLPWNDALIHQVIVSSQANLRNPVAHAKTRAEVSGGGRKPWRQKGTGRARHGSTRSPIWVGGGATHGPVKERDFSKKINKKMKKKALFVALSQKLKDGEILVLDDLKVEQAKTKEANKIILNLSKIDGFQKLQAEKQNRALILLNKMESNLKRSFRNLPGIFVEESRNLNVLDSLTYKHLIFSKSALLSLK